MKYLLALFMLIVSNTCYAILVSGKVTDKTGAPLAFVNIYQKNTSKGTNTNAEGHYRIDFSPGEYELVYKLIGYHIVFKKIKVNETDKEIKLDVSLEEEEYHLHEVVVKKNYRDPAYEIIEKAQAKRNYYKDGEMESFSCRAYVKGLAKLGKADVKNKLFGIKLFDAPRLPQNKIVYLSESVSEVNFLKPDKYKEKMIHSRVSGQARNYSFATAYAMFAEVNFYHNYLSLGDVYERPFISPIAGNAMNHYAYELEETFTEYSEQVHKIKVTPLKKIGPFFYGYIYIVEGSWRIHSVNLNIDKGTGIEYIDTLNIQQTFAPQKDSIWALINLKFNIKFSFDVKVASAEGSGYVIGVFSDYKIKPVKKALAVPLPDKTATEKKPAKNNKPPKKTATEKKEEKQAQAPFKGALMEVLPESNKLDTTAWNDIRPLELTPEEIRDFVEKDSVEKVRSTKSYKDSVDKKNNKLKVANLIFGYTYRNSFRKQRYVFKPLYNDLQYNTMEGWVINPGFEFRKRFEDDRYIEISPYGRYGFSNTHFNAKVDITYYYKPIRWASFKVSGGKFVSDFNYNEGITPFVNSLYTLFQRQNYMKMYEKAYLSFSHNSEITNGVFLSTGVEYAHRTPLDNTTDYSVHSNKRILFTPNNPVWSNAPLFTTNDALTWYASLKFSFKQKYLKYPNRKITFGSKYPTISINYGKGIPSVFGSNVNFDFVSAKIEDSELDLKKYGKAAISVEGGGFVNNNSTTFADYKHFNGNQTIFTRNGLKNTFWLLDYYRYSTNQYYVEAHWEHHLNGYLSDRIPLMRKLGWQLVNSANYLYTPGSSHYFEAALGFEHVFKYLRIDYAVGLQYNQPVTHGLKIGLGF